MKKIIVFTGIISALLGASMLVYAQDSAVTNNVLENLQDAGAHAGVGRTGTPADTPGEVIGRVIGQILIVIGIVFLILVTAGGIMWMTSGGNEEQVAKGRRLLGNALVGLGITVGAFLITRFVMIVVFRGAEPTFIGL